jgi:hypothetical protein
MIPSLSASTQFETATLLPLPPADEPAIDEPMIQKMRKSAEMCRVKSKPEQSDSQHQLRYQLEPRTGLPWMKLMHLLVKCIVWILGMSIIHHATHASSALHQQLLVPGLHPALVNSIQT